MVVTIACMTGERVSVFRSFERLKILEPNGDSNSHLHNPEDKIEFSEDS